MNYKILLLTVFIALLTACGNQQQGSQTEIETPVSVQEGAFIVVLLDSSP